MFPNRASLALSFGTYFNLLKCTMIDILIFKKWYILGCGGFTATLNNSCHAQEVVIHNQLRCTGGLQAQPQQSWALPSVDYIFFYSVIVLPILPGTTHTGSVMGSIPTFSPVNVSESGLDLLAAAAAASTVNPSIGGVLPTLSQITKSGPYNPAAAIPARIVKRILELDFVELSEITMDDDLPQQTPGRPRLPITDIYQWVERFSVMAALLSSRFPLKAPEFWAYQASIVRAERNYEGRCWVAYDRQFRREALSRKDINWSVPDPRLYNEAFTGRDTKVFKLPPG